jgi:hypothetical protein
MDHGGEALVGLVGAHGDAFEILDVEGQSLDERRHDHRVEELSRQEHQAHEVERQDFGGHAALRTADRLTLSLPFAPRLGRDASGIRWNFSRRKNNPSVRSLAQSIAAWHQAQADVRAGNGAVIQRHDGNVNDVQRLGWS